MTPTTHTSTMTATQIITSTLIFAVIITSVKTAVDATMITNSTNTKRTNCSSWVTTRFFVIVLTAVIIGWVWTCWTIKRRGRMDISSKNTTMVINTNKQHFQNLLYEDSSYEENSTSSSVNNEAPQNPSSSATIYNTIDKNEEDGPAYDVLSREKSTDRRRKRVVSNLPESEDTADWVFVTMILKETTN